MGSETANGGLRFTQAGWLVPQDGVEAVPTTRTVALDQREPLAVVWHWTASRGKGEGHARALAESISSGHGPSWHLVVGRTGQIVQSAGLLTGTNHVGRLGSIGGVACSINRNTVGIELENAGRVMRVKAGPYRTGRITSRIVEGTKDAYVVEGEEIGHRTAGWRQVENPQDARSMWRPSSLDISAEEIDATRECHLFTASQLAAAERLVRAIASFLAWDAARFKYGHADFDPDRKADPGPLWREVELPRILASALGAA